MRATNSSLGDPPRCDDVALFLHTSGTTSRPKGVPLTHANLAASLVNIVETYELTPNDRSLLVMPLFHVHGLMAGAYIPQSLSRKVSCDAGGPRLIWWPASLSVPWMQRHRLF